MPQQIGPVKTQNRLILFMLWKHPPWKGACSCSNQENLVVGWFCFFIPKRSSKTMLLWRHFACSCFLEGREVNTIATKVPYLWLKKRGCEKGKNALALGWKTDTHFSVRFKCKHKNRTAYWNNYSLLNRFIAGTDQIHYKHHIDMILCYSS